MSTIRVACKLPQGLTVEHAGKTVTLNGANDQNARFGHGYTDVDADWFAAWSTDHADFPPLKRKLIFAHAKDTEGAAKEAAPETKTGFEALDPTKPAPGIEPTDEQKRELAKLPNDPAA